MIERNFVNSNSWCLPPTYHAYHGLRGMVCDGMTESTQSIQYIIDVWAHHQPPARSAWIIIIVFQFTIAKQSWVFASNCVIGAVTCYPIARPN